MIRSATTHDVHRIATLLREKAELFKKRGSRQWSAYLESDLEVLVKRDLNVGRLFVYEHGPDLLGSVALLPSLEWDQALWSDKEGLYIHRIVVSESAKGLGIGTRLLQHAIAVAEAEQEALRLDCLASNDFLNGYYTSFGFEPKGVRDGFATYEYAGIPMLK